MSSPLDRLSAPTGPLAAEPADADEFARLRKRASGLLRDAEVPGLDLEGRFTLAYAAVHAMCNAALRHAGYRARSRYIVFQAVPHTLGLDATAVRFLTKCHELRNLGEYEGELNVTERLVLDLLAAAKRVAEALERLPPL